MNKQQRLEKYVQQRNFKEAIKLLEPICRKQQHNIQCWLTLASYYGQDGQYKNVIRVCKKIYAANRTLPQINSLMGNAYASMGELDQAYGHYTIALESAPNDPGLLNNLGNCLFLDNKFEEAADVFKKVIKAQPDYADAHGNLGTIYKALNKYSLSVEHFRMALQLDPGQFRTMLNLGHVYAGQFGFHEQAIECFENALKHEPDNIETYAALSSSLRFLGRYEEVLQKLKQLRSERRDPALLLGEEADIYARTGEYKKALDLIDIVISNGGFESDIMSISVLLRICNKFDRCTQAIDAAERVVADTNIPDKARSYLQFFIGQVYDERKQYDKAFRCYEAANDLADVSFDFEKHSQEFKALRTSYTRERLAKITKSSIDTSTPVFIIGMPRSGTSLTEQILACHPEVCGAGELNFLRDIAADLPKRIRTGSTYPSCITEIDRATVEAVAKEYLDKLRAICGKTRYVTDKMPHNFVRLGLISILFPQAKVIHCTRDPIDTCLSIYFQNINSVHPYSGKLEWLGKYYKNYERLMQHWTSELDIPIHIVNYEAMISDQEKTTRGLLEFCELPWNEECLNFNQSSRRVTTASYDQVRQKLYTKSVARWKNYENHIQSLIQALGAT